VSDQPFELAKARIQKVFSYIRELTKLRTPPVSKLESYEWSLRFSSLSKYPTIQTSQIVDGSDFDGVVLRVKRPNETPCPPFPEILSDWIENGWENLTGVVRHIQARNFLNTGESVRTERFEDNSERVTAFGLWSSKRRDWQEAEKPVREAAEVFANLFKLHGQLQRESEKYQLYLGDGHLVWNSAIEVVNHPVLLKKIELEFDSNVPEFTIRELDDSSELYTALLRYHQLDGNAILACKKLLDESERHPLAHDKTTEFLKFFIQRFFENGSLIEHKGKSESSNPVIYRDPVVFLGTRSQGFAEALDKLIESLPSMESLPEALLRIVGVDEKVSPDTIGGLVQADGFQRLPSSSKVDFLLTKPANKEQERVITRLEETGSVLVQGPPGTGKSHTIANIIGHLLANGKTILVSSHTSKALKVVREKVVKPLQPLCVSVLDNDMESKSQLEESINGIVSYLSRNDAQSLENEIEQLGHRRFVLKDQLERLESRALNIRKNEYVDIVVAGEGIPPSEAARRVSSMEKEHSWIPSPVVAGSPIPLRDTELMELYSTNTSLNATDEKCLGEGLPDLNTVLTPVEMRELAADIRGVSPDEAAKFKSFWSHNNQQPLELERITNDLGQALTLFTTHKWIQKVVEDTRLGRERTQPWVSLIDSIENTNKEIAKRIESVLQHGPVVNLPVNQESIQICKGVLTHLLSGKSLSFFVLTLNPAWKAFVKAVQVDEGVPTRIDHFEAILGYMEIAQLRKEISRRWDRQVTIIGGPKLSATEPEVEAKTFSDAVKYATSWTTSVWSSIESSLSDQGFVLKAAMETHAVEARSGAFIEQLKSFAEEVLIPSMISRTLWLRLRDVELLRERTLQEIRTNAQKVFNREFYLADIEQAVLDLDVDRYQNAYDKFIELTSKVSIFDKRRILIEKLAKLAPAWAKAIELRAIPHNTSEIPGQTVEAWNFIQWKQELDKRISQDYSLVQREIQRVKSELNGVNAQYVEKLAWKFQHSRTGLKEKQALTGWQQLQNKITKSGRGVRDTHVKREARKALKDCKNAVPVWIMPLSRVYESFDLVQTKFDVILLDEASQSDISALVAFSIAKQVIVVGDNEQVTPQAVGQELGKIQSLIDELLQGIPNRMLYDGRTSVYDLAEQAFGETIRLVEHFRCVPDIIEFSNQLSYNGEIRPLREASSSPYQNHLVAHRVQGASSQNKVNLKEANEVASIVMAMTESPAYKDASIGVISMVGQEQALVIDTILQRKMSSDVYAKHRILCGNASQFQGDERRVIVISMVDSCDTPPLSIRQADDYKKAFNVAASRAQDQLWVVHSLNPSTDLKVGDLRLRLIQHAENPRALRQAIEATQKRADPKSVVFEPMVIKDLMQAGFRVTPQFSVGAYTIDMIVEGKTKKVAVECDGDRYHPPEKLTDDIHRQVVLERLGWTFIRIRGSEYFRHRETTMNRVFGELESLGVEKLGPANATNDNTSDNDELKAAIIIRASEIQTSWEENSESDIDVDAVLKSKRSRWTKKSKEIKEESKVEIVGSVAVKLEPSKYNHLNEESVAERLRRKRTSPDHLQNNDMRNGGNHYQRPSQELTAILIQGGFEVIDKSSSGGALWVIDIPAFKEMALHLQTSKGVRFSFAPKGGKATGNRPAWYVAANRKDSDQ
jgi:very-short-patch-repair endonuclease